MPETATRQGQRATPKWPQLTQKERVVRYLRQHDELERTEAGQVYHIGRLAARIKDLRNEGYVIDSRKDENGIAHYSLVSEPNEDGAQDAEPGLVSVDTAEDLWRALPDGSLARDYVALLARCAKGDQTIGVLEDAIKPEAVSDWEAAMCIGRDVTVEAITGVRRKLCRESPLVQEQGHRKAKKTYRLHEDLI